MFSERDARMLLQALQRMMSAAAEMSVVQDRLATRLRLAEERFSEHPGCRHEVRGLDSLRLHIGW